MENSNSLAVGKGALSLTEPTFVKRANLIALIGLDGAGKTTQARLLGKWLRERGHKVVLPANESLLPYKTAIRAVAEASGNCDPIALVGGLEVHQILTAIIKWNGMMKAREAIEQADQFVIMDRYTYCYVAAQRFRAVKNGWLIEKLFAFFPEPDLTLFLDISPEESVRRIEKRGIDVGDIDLLKGHLKAYHELEGASSFVVVDAEQPEAKVTEDIRAQLHSRFTDDILTL